MKGNTEACWSAWFDTVAIATDGLPSDSMETSIAYTMQHRSNGSQKMFSHESMWQSGSASM